MTARARHLRHALTDAEQTLWKALRRNALSGASFRRQHPVGPYVLDFYCPSARLAVEIDGGQHALPDAQVHDRRRDARLVAKNIRMLRFWNNDVSSNLDGVLQTIAAALNAEMTPSRRTTCADLPLAGGGRRGSQP
jgi:very-short-patch-repair endonuclease